ncbi:YheC/YheD family protein [Paenibacillus sp. RC67]|uniref:YheC/YheD family endospore coat-associated protein n=1 Tax=Paenibacillus sp. RC67 TaxID=3039392 RepID=UPI0024AE5DF3|nr:YheC/YheD family protein [Paenibacillus sp. RC67]
MATLGIMLDRIIKSEYKWQIKAMKPAGFEKVLLFTPDHVNLQTKRISGWVYANNQWKYHSVSPFPTLIYDRGEYSGHMLLRAKQVKEKAGIPFIGEWLGNNKWSIQTHLATNPKLRPHLIPSNLLNDIQSIQAMINKYKTVIIKPLGTHSGIGILKLSLRNGKYTIDEDSKKSLSLSKAGVTARLKVIRNKKRYMIQRWIDITDKSNRVYDIRVLIQKNERGIWHITGMGVRLGKVGNITSNLATGGEAEEIVLFLTKQFGAAKARMIQNRLRTLTNEIAVHLERSYHKRLVELGLDFGIDKKSNIWIIEVNTKPGKKLLEQVGTLKTFKESLQLPIYYAGFLRAKTRSQTE